jgi:hypothetical protein
VALTTQALALLARHLPGKRILSFGYPDLVASAEEIERLFGVRPTRFTAFGRWHGVDFPLPETLEVLGAIGATLECVDIHPSRGVERVVDLNLPCALGRFDLVIDAGTIEHCFNIGQALLNAAQAVEVGGCVFHGPPMTMLNHGFYNINPTLFHDFYVQNGWTLEALIGGTREGKFKVHPTGRFAGPPEAVLYCIARRARGGPLVFPTQTKYLANPDLA